MNENPIFDNIRQLIAQDNTRQALQTLIQYVAQSKGPKELLRALRVAESNFNAIRQKESKGILSFAEARSEYARVNDAVLSLLDELEAGRNPASDGRSRRTWLLIIAAVLPIGLSVGYWLNTRKTNSEPNNNQPAYAALQCPNFRAEGFKIMVLEFQKLSGDDSKPELGIQSRIRDLTERNQMATDVKILPGSEFGNEPPDLRDAINIGKQCAADMVIWGNYEKETQGIMVDIRYAFTSPDWPPGAASETFKNVSELKSDRMKIADLDEAVFRLCTALALHENRMDLAEKWLNKLKTPDEREAAWKKQLKWNQ